MNLQPILDDCGLNIKTHQPAHGGDINACFVLHAIDKNYFLKINEAKKYPAMFEKEARGLNALRINGSLTIPSVVKTGTVNSYQYLLLEWLEAGKPIAGFWESFGAALATMHGKEQAYFGWEEDNYIGSLHQVNNHHDNWETFYAACRITPLVKALFDLHVFNRKDVDSGIALCKKLGDLFPKEPPSLLHGDLWSGNYRITTDGKPAIFDPAVYLGHREMDIGMTLLFGGFDRQFYEGYQQVYPLETGWQQRLRLMQLYPLLVHAVLFGGHYITRCREIIREFN